MDGQLFSFLFININVIIETITIKIMLSIRLIHEKPVKQSSLINYNTQKAPKRIT